MGDGQGTVAEAPLITRDFVLLVGGHLLQGLGWASMLLLPVYLDHLQATRATLGTVMAMAPLGGLVFRPLVGWSLDRLGRRPTLFAGTALLASSLAALGLVHAIGPLVYAIRFVMGIGLATLFTAYFTTAADLIPEARRTEGLALFGISGLVPLLVNPLTGRLDLPPEALRVVFVAVGALVASSAVLVRLVPEPGGGAPRRMDWRGVWPALSSRRLLPVWLATLCFAGLVAVFMAFVTVTAADRGVADPTVIWLMYAGAAIGVRALGARVPARLGLRRMAAVSLAAYIAGVVLSAIGTGPLSFSAAGLLAGFGHGACFPVLTSWTASRSPAHLRGTAMTMYTALWDVVALALVPIAGGLADATSDATMLLTVAGAATVTLGGWWLLEREPEPPIPAGVHSPRTRPQ